MIHHSHHNTVLIGALAVGAIYIFYSKNKQGQSPINQASQRLNGALSSQPSSQYPFVVPQAQRADNNPALNNQPFAQQVMNQAVTNMTSPANIASIAGSVSNIFSSLFSNSTGTYDNSSSGTQDLAYFNSYAGGANAGGSTDPSNYDPSYNDPSNWGFA